MTISITAKLINGKFATIEIPDAPGLVDDKWENHLIGCSLSSGRLSLEALFRSASVQHVREVELGDK